MLKKRIIPVLTFNGFALVKTKQFKNPRMVGNPMQAARIYNSRNVDELIFVDIMATKQNRKINLSVVKQVINECFMPVTIGGGIKTLDDISDLLQIGADKVVLKSVALKDPGFVSEAVKRFGSQAIVISVDVIHKDGVNMIYDDSVSIKASEFVKKMEQSGAGELFVNDVDNDGMMQGFNTGMFNEISSQQSLPIIVCGGAGIPDHFGNLFQDRNITGAAASSIYHFTQFTPFDIKHAVSKKGFPVRLFDKHLTIGVNE